MTERSRARTVAVVIPAYQAGDFVLDALESVAAQTRAPDELVVVDDGSTDDTAARVREWSAGPGRSARLLRQQNTGAAGARSAGLRAVASDLVVSLDADDTLVPTALETLVSAFDTWPDLAASFGNAERIGTDGRRGADYLSGKPVHDLPAESATRSVPGVGAVPFRRIGQGTFESLLGGSYIANCAALVRREAALEAGLWSREFRTAEDRGFWLRLSRIGAFAYTSRCVARVRYHERNLTGARGVADHAANGARVLQKMKRITPRLALSEGEVRALDAALEAAVEEALYAASREGATAYLRAVRTLRDGRTRVPWIRPRHLMRALLAGAAGTRSAAEDPPPETPGHASQDAAVPHAAPHEDARPRK